jgi:hypothetical protein
MLTKKLPGYKDKVMKKSLVLLLILLITLNQSAFAAISSDYVSIDMTQVPLSSKLKKDYQAFKYIITNTSTQNVNLVNAQVTNGQNGASASNAVDNGSGVGTLWAVMGPVGLFTFGIGWLVGLVGTPIVLLTSKGKNKKARREGQGFSNIVDLGLLTSGDSTSVQTLIPIGATPQLKVTFQEPGTKELLMVSR